MTLSGKGLQGRGKGVFSQGTVWPQTLYRRYHKI